MKKFLLVFSIIFVSFFAQNALASKEQIENYNVEIEISSDSVLYVTESIEYNFSTNRKHGIYRLIPTLDKDLSETPFRIFDVVVSDDLGHIYNKKVSDDGDNINIKIGDPDEYVTGLKTYIISYKVQGAFLFEEESDNLFWNAIGTDWNIEILKNNITVYLSESLNEEQFRDVCYYGEYGSTTECPPAFFMKYHDTAENEINNIVFKTKTLQPGQGATINLFFDKGIINEPPPPNIIIAWIKKFGFIFLPIISFLLMFYLWYSRGRDPEGRGNIIVQYDAPKGIMPAEAGTVYDETTHNHDISAEIIYLAIHGYIKIRRIEKKVFFSKKDDFLLEKLKEPTDLKRHYQIKLMNKLFGKPSALGEFVGIETTPDAMAIVKLSDLKKTAHKWIKEVEDQINDSVIKKGYFDKSPKKTKAKYMLLFALVFIIYFGFLASDFGVMIRDFLSLSDGQAVAWGFSSMAAFIIAGAFGMAMPKRTLEGVLVKEHILGLKEYIDVAEKERIKFHNAPEKDPETFEKLLPYAMVFKLEKKWAKKFEGIYLDEPSWYVAGQGAHFSAVAFGNSLGDFRTTSSGAMTTSSSGGTSSGGFSGGGGGGGGGGSW